MADILLADDDETLHPLIASVLEVAGHTISFASNGKIACEMIQGGAYDLIILDYDMPLKNGVEVLTDLKTDNIVIPPTIMLTARGEPEIIQSCIKAGARDFVVKPFSVEEVARRVEKQLEGMGGGGPGKNEKSGGDIKEGWPGLE